MITILHQEAASQTEFVEVCLFDVGMFSSSQKALVVPDIIVHCILDDEHLYFSNADWIDKRLIRFSVGGDMCLVIWDLYTILLLTGQ